MDDKFKGFIKEGDKPGIAEYGLVITGIALVVLVAVFVFGPKIYDMLRAVEEHLTILGGY